MAHTQGWRLETACPQGLPRVTGPFLSEEEAGGAGVQRVVLAGFEALVLGGS